MIKKSPNRTLTTDGSPDLTVEHRPVASLTPRRGNPRTHSAKQVREIAASIETFGFTNPVLIEAKGTVIAGHGRVLAAKLLSMETVPTIRIEHLSDAQVRAHVLADNKLALNAGWDEELLAMELQGLLATELDFDISVTGFSIPEIDSLIEGLNPEDAGDPKEDVLPEIEDGPAVSQPGDLWQLGPHRLICGNALVRETYDALLGDQRAQMVISDPPFNVRIAGHVGGSGAIQRREFIMASREMSPEAFTSFLEKAFSNLAAFSVDGSIHFVFMDWRHLPEILAAGQAAYTELKNLIVWVKDNGGMGTFYRSRHELILAFKHGTAPHVNSFELGQHGRHRTNVWEYKGVNTLKAGRLEELARHPTAKPVDMIAEAIKDVSQRGAIVLDAFGGGGSTLIAAHKTGRRARLIELDPIYVDRTIRRWQSYAHDDAFLTATGDSFNDLAVARIPPIVRLPTTLMCWISAKTPGTWALLAHRH